MTNNDIAFLVIVAGLVTWIGYMFWDDFRQN